VPGQCEPHAFWGAGAPPGLPLGSLITSRAREALPSRGSSGGLHLKSACTLASATTLVYAPGVLAPDALDVLRAAGLTCVPALEPEGANVLAFGDVVVVSADAPRTADSLAALGLEIRAIRATALHAADGGLTCLSLRMARDGEWTA